ncbi:hypothetical protein AB6813_14135 [bacterium RCC_150]
MLSRPFHRHAPKAAKAAAPTSGPGEHPPYQDLHGQAEAATVPRPKARPAIDIDSVLVRAALSSLSPAT